MYLATIMTQEEKILLALQEAGQEGINSYVAREQLKIIQLPARVWGLKQKGHTIIERTNSDKSVNYILTDSPRVKKLEVSHNVFNEDDYVLVGNTFVRKERLEPKQMEAFI